jgi:hypothetical protein
MADARSRQQRPGKVAIEVIGDVIPADETNDEVRAECRRILEIKRRTNPDATLDPLDALMALGTVLRRQFGLSEDR